MLRNRIEAKRFSPGLLLNVTAIHIKNIFRAEYITYLLKVQGISKLVLVISAENYSKNLVESTVCPI